MSERKGVCSPLDQTCSSTLRSSERISLVLNRTDKASPIYGMPILDADKARGVIVLKRSMAAGFAGIENDLFYDPRTAMLFGDAKSSLSALIAEMKNV